MKQNKFLPSAACVIAALVLFIFPYFIIGNSALDIHLHDSYIVIAETHLWYAIGIFFMLLALIYIVPWNFWLSVKLIWLHIISSLVLLIVIFFPRAYEESNSVQRYYDYSSWESMVQFGELNKILIAHIALFLLVQLLFVYHIVVSVIFHFRLRKK